MDIYYKATTDSPVSLSPEEDTPTKPGTDSAATVTRPDTPMQTSPTLLLLAQSPKQLVRLQISLQHQPHLYQLERYFNSQVEIMQNTLEQRKNNKGSQHYPY